MQHDDIIVTFYISRICNAVFFFFFFLQYFNIFVSENILYLDIAFALTKISHFRELPLLKSETACTLFTE